MATRAAKAPARKPAAKKTGRPSKFDGRLLGLTNSEMAKVLGVATSTFALWIRDQQTLRDAIARGRDAADGKVARGLYERACGYSHPEVVITSYQGDIQKTRVTRHYPPDTQAASIWLRNRQPQRWRRDPDPADGTDDAPPPTKVVIEVKDARRRPEDAGPQSPTG
jgi:hypothetical protein